MDRIKSYSIGLSGFEVNLLSDIFQISLVCIVSRIIYTIHRELKWDPSLVAVL